MKFSEIMVIENKTADIVALMPTDEGLILATTNELYILKATEGQPTKISFLNMEVDDERTWKTDNEHKEVK